MKSLKNSVDLFRMRKVLFNREQFKNGIIVSRRSFIDVTDVLDPLSI